MGALVGTHNLTLRITLCNYPIVRPAATMPEPSYWISVQCTTNQCTDTHTYGPLYSSYLCTTYRSTTKSIPRTSSINFLQLTIQYSNYPIR